MPEVSVGAGRDETSLNSTPNWDGLGCYGMNREGEAIAGIADIARNRRDRKKQKP